MKNCLTRLNTLAVFSPRRARAVICVANRCSLGGEECRGTRSPERYRTSACFAGLTDLLRRLRASLASVLAASVLLAGAACKHAPASSPRPAANDEHSQQPATAPAADSAPVPVPVEQPRFAVQVAAFNDRPSAEALASQLSDHFGLQTVVAPVESQGVTLYRVRLLVVSKDQAEKLADTFWNTEKLRVWIVPL